MDATVLTVSNGDILFVNRAAGKLFGMTEQELIQGGQQSVVAPGDNDWDKVISSIEKTGQFLGEIRLRKKDGSSFPAEVSASVFNDTEGRELLSVIIRDITKRKQTEKRLKKSENRYRRLFENMGSGVIIYKVTNRGLIIQDMNPAGEKVIGTSRQTAIGKNPFELWPGTRRLRLDHYVKQVLKTNKPVYFPASIFLNGKLKTWIEVELYPLPGGEIVSIFDDVTQRECALDALKENEAKFRMVIETVNDGLALFSAEGVILSWNKGAEKLTGLKAENIVGKKAEKGYLKAVHEDGSLCRFEDFPSVQTLNTGRPVVNKILGIIQSSGKVRWVFENTTPLFHSNSTRPSLVCVSFSDISDFKKNKEDLEHQVRQRTGQLEEMNGALKVLLGKREQDLDEIEKRLLANCETLITPLLTRLKTGSEDQHQRQLIDVIRQNLMSVLSPFSKKLADPLRRLTPAEIQISAMITQGLANKEMAQILNVSIRTITNHRDNIRKKLNLKNRKINLRSYLAALK